MALKNFTQFTPQTVLSATDYVVGYRALDEIRTDLDSLTVAISGLLISKGFTPGGTSLGTVRRISYRYTIGGASNLNAVSGTDDFSLNLSYTPGQIEVYRNGSHLAESLDFVASNSTQVTNMSTFNVGDIIEVVALSATGLTITNVTSGGGSIFQSNYRYTCPSTVAIGAVTISGPDDLGNTLLYSSPTLDVYLNGSHLVNGLDYSASNGTSITLTEGLSSSDVVDVATLSAYDIVALGGVSRIVAGPGIILNPGSGLGDVTITGNTLQLTGGNITIPFGVGTTKPNLQTALDSISSFIFDDSANVILQAREGFINPPSGILYLDHPYSNKITISGMNVPFQTTFSTNFSGSDTPVTAVSGGKTTSTAPTTAFAVSATITYDPAYSIPSAGQYILISGVSGRHAEYHTSGPYDISSQNGRMTFHIQMDHPGESMASIFLQTRGNKILVNKFTNTSQISSYVFTISGAQTIVPAYYGAKYIVCEEAYTSELSNIGDAIFAVGNSNSYRQTTFTQAGSTLTFSDGTPTNTYLNPGDHIIALGQAVCVDSVGSTNTCELLSPFRCSNTTATSGNATTITSPRPFLIKTMFEQYRGCHQVRSVNTSNNTCVIEVFCNFSMGTSQFPSAYGIMYPLPKYGIHSIGAKVDFNVSGLLKYSYPQGTLLKSIMSFDKNIISDGSFKSIENIVFHMAATNDVNFLVGTVTPTVHNFTNVGFAGIGSMTLTNNETYRWYLAVSDNSLLNLYNTNFSSRNMTVELNGGGTIYYSTFSGGQVFLTINSRIVSFTKHSGGCVRLNNNSTAINLVSMAPTYGANYSDGSIDLIINKSILLFSNIWAQHGFGYVTGLANASSVTFTSLHGGYNNTNIDNSVNNFAYNHMSNSSNIGLISYVGKANFTNNAFINCVYAIYFTGNTTGATSRTYGFARGGGVGDFFALNTNAITFIGGSSCSIEIISPYFRNNDYIASLDNTSLRSFIGFFQNVNQSFNTNYIAGGIVANANTGFTGTPATGNLLSII